MNKIRIGTRSSQLALRQTESVVNAIKIAHPDLELEIVEIKTSGDWTPAQGENRLSESDGGKGLFAKEIEQAILSGEIDCGVHSMKDMPTNLPEGLIIRHMLKREDPRETLISSSDIKSVEELPKGAKVGTSSVRRQALLLNERPDLEIVPLRGNVTTRLEKLENGQADAIILAYCGLKRLGLHEKGCTVIPIEKLLPAAGQGAIGVEIKESNKDLAEILSAIHCETTGMCIKAERAALRVLDGSCHTPIAAHAKLVGQFMHLLVKVASLDGTQLFEEEFSGPVNGLAEADWAGRHLGERLLKIVPQNILAD
jgi:hydroxymethylbilane synthase